MLKALRDRVNYLVELEKKQYENMLKARLRHGNFSEEATIQEIIYEKVLAEATDRTEEPWLIESRNNKTKK